MKKDIFKNYKINGGYVTTNGDIFYKGEIIGHCDPLMVSFHDYVIDLLDYVGADYELVCPEDDIDWEELDRLAY